MIHFEIFFGLVTFRSGPPSRQNASVNSPLAKVWMALSQLVLKLSWDDKRPASSDFTIGKRKKSAEQFSWEVALTLWAARDSRTEALFGVRNQSRDGSPDHFILEITSQSLLGGGSID